MFSLLSAALAADVQRYAVIIGTNEGLPGDQTLAYAELDADRVASVLVDLGDVRSEDILALRRADAARVRSALLDLGARIARNRGDAETMLFFYYSGHADADGLHLQGTKLALDELTEMLAAVPVDVRVLVVDACQSGELTRLKGAAPAEPFTIHADDRLDSEGMAIITSSSAGEDAQESDRLRGGMFTHHFLAGLMGAADSSGDKRVTLTEAYRYGRTETIRATSQARFVQHPSYAFELRGQSDLVLTRIDEPGQNALIGLSEPGSWLVFEDGGELLTEVTVDQASSLSLSPGEYLVRLRSPRGVWERDVSLARGTSLELTSAGMAPVSYGATVRKGLRQGTAWALTAGGGVVGSPGFGLWPMGQISALVDLEPITLVISGRGATHTSSNDQLTSHQVKLGADVTGIRKIDARFLSVGLGLRAGADLTLQRFETAGLAPPRRGGSARVGPLLSIDLPLGSPRTIGIVSAGSDISVMRLYDSETQESVLTTAVLPTLSLELGRYAR